MPRQIVIRTPDGSEPILIEVPAESEHQLQELMKDKPDLLPVEEFELTGPLLVVGRETTVASGAIDLACIARSGEILIIEFKTGPQNTDFRHAVAQLIDYGSHIWGLDFAEFESSVAVRFFNDARCTDDRLKSQHSLEAAATVVWDGLTQEEWSGIRSKIESQLSSGGFHYLLVAQRFTPTIQRALEYVNAVAPACRFFAVELVKFAGSGLEAFESRTFLKPSVTSRRPTSLVNEAGFLSQMDDERYRNTVQEILEACRGFGYRFEWGAVGGSIRLVTPFRPEPITIAWVFPPGKSGWMGLTDLSLGFDRWSADNAKGSTLRLEDYAAKVSRLPGAERTRAKNLVAYHFSPEAVIESSNAITELLAELKSQMG